MAHMNNRSFKGAITAEASMILPFVVICILPFIYLFRMLLCQMVLEKGMDECLKQMAIEMYLLERVSILPEYAEGEETEIDQNKVEQLQGLLEEYTAVFEEDEWESVLQECGYELIGEMLLKQKMKQWLDKENLNAWGIENGWDGITATESDFLYEKQDHHYLIKGVISFEWKALFSFWNPKKVTIKRVYHCFVGEEMSLDETGEKSESSAENVVYRIGSGTKYHSAECYLINKDVFSSTKEQAAMEGKQPCERCTPIDLITVYQTKGGECYHAKSCSYLNPEIKLLEREEAIQLGYTGCRLCQEAIRYFS